MLWVKSRTCKISQLGRQGNKKLPKIKGFTHFHLNRLELEKFLYEWTKLEVIARSPEFILSAGCAAQQKRYKLEDAIRERVFGTDCLDEIGVMMGVTRHAATGREKTRDNKKIGKTTVVKNKAKATSKNIRALLRKLNRTEDSKERRKIRRQLRKLGHTGGTKQ